MKKMMLLAAIVLFAASGARAATWNWTNNVNNAWWTNANSWAEGTVPANDGTADIVLNNTFTAAYSSFFNENWSINSLRYVAPANNYAFYIIPNTAASQTLSLGGGGVFGTNRWLHLYSKVTFTASDVSLNYGNIYFYNTIDSSASGGTTLRMKGADWQYFQFANWGSYSPKATTNITWSMEGGQVAIYNTDPNDVFGTKKVLVGGANSGQRYIGFYGNSASNDIYIDANFEIDQHIIDNSPNLSFVINKGHSTAGQTQITHMRGSLSTKTGAAFTNTSGIGVFQFYGGNNDMKKRLYWEGDNSGLTSAAVGTGSWSGDFAILSGWQVVNAAHAFKSNNSARVNLADQSGGATTITNRQFLLASGVTYNGDVCIYGGSSLADKSQAKGWLGLEGTGSAEYKGNILFNRWDDHGAYGNRGFDAVFYATNGGTAIFSGDMSEINVGGSVKGQKAYITGGGQVTFKGSGNYTNTTTVTSNTTFQLDNWLASSVLTIESGSTLKGTGEVGGNLVVSGNLKPGNSIGTLYADGDVTLNSTAVFEAELSLASHTGDVLYYFGTLAVDGTLKLIGGKAGETYVIARTDPDFPGTLIGTFASVDTTDLTSGLSLDGDGVVYGKDGSISLTVIPEPASVLLMVSGLAAAWKLRRRA